MAQFHLKVLKEFKDVNISAISSTKRGLKKRLEIKKKYKIKNQYSSVKSMLKREKLDGVFIVPSVDKVFNITEQCLKKGINSFIEKPPALSIDKLKKLINLQKKKKCTTMVGLQRRFYSNILYAKKFAKKHGGISSIVIEAPENFSKILSKKKFKKNVINRWIFANGIHALDLFSFFGGKIAKILALRKNFYYKQHPDSLHALIKFKNKIFGNYISNWMSPGFWSIKIYGLNYKIYIKPLEKGIIINKKGKISNLPISRVDKAFKPGLYNQNRKFIDLIKNKKKNIYPGISLEQSLNSMKLCSEILGKK